MRSLVVYESLLGNTEAVAQAIAEGLRERGSSTAVPIHRVSDWEIEGARLVVVGGPTQLRGATRGLRAFVRSPFRRGLWRQRPVAVFDTRFRGDPVVTGSAAAELARRLRRAGAIVIATPASFFVEDFLGPLGEGEVQRALLWGRSLHLGERVPVAEGE